jgi:hypothetical protein
MQHIRDGALWRPNFVAALRLLGRAVARLPFGVPDPVVCGAAAVELYTGGLWPATDLELLAVEARPLAAELLAVGFRWAERPLRRDRGLWHPDLAIGVEMIAGLADVNLAALSNVLRVVLDGPPQDAADPTPVWLKVVGIEDLLAEQISSWIARKSPAGDISARIHALDALSRAGVGGRLRAGYLQRRVAWEIRGEVVLGSWLSGEGPEPDPVARTTSLTYMQAAITTWRARCGLSFDPTGAGTQRRDRGQVIRGRNDRSGRAGGSCGVSANVVPFDATSSAPQR